MTKQGMGQYFLVFLILAHAFLVGCSVDTPAQPVYTEIMVKAGCTVDGVYGLIRWDSSIEPPLPFWGNVARGTGERYEIGADVPTQSGHGLTKIIAGDPAGNCVIVRMY